MKSSVLIFSFITILNIYYCVCQEMSVPKNVKETVNYLKLDISDSIASLIINTPDDSLENWLKYPLSKNFDIINNWMQSKKKKSVDNYLSKKGVSQSYHQKLIIILSTKHSLSKQRIREKKVIQPFKQKEENWKAFDKIRFDVDSIGKKYIPKDIYECFTQLDSFWDDEKKNKVKSETEEEFSASSHFGIGLWMRNNWSLWGGSRLSKYFNEHKIYHPDNMSGIILKCYHRYLTGNEILFDEEIKYYVDEADKKNFFEFEKYSDGDTVIYKFPLGFINKKQKERHIYEEQCEVTGKVLSKNHKNFTVNILVTESCGRKGILSLNTKKAEEFPNTELTGKRFIKNYSVKTKQGEITTAYFWHWSLFNPQKKEITH